MPLNLPSQAHLTKMYGTSDPELQLHAIITLRETLEQQYTDKLIAAAPESLSCFTELMTPEEPPAYHHNIMCEYLEKIEAREIMRATFSLPPGHAKSCSIFSDLATPTGFKKMGDIVVGDTVFGTRGPTKVIAKSETFYKPCYRAITSDGVEVVVSEDHLWTVYRDRNAKVPETFSTKELYDRYTNSKDPRAFRLPDYAPLEYSEKDLPIDPYILGYWLGDGTSERGRITVSDEDRAHAEAEFHNAGYSTSDDKGRITFTTYGLRTKLGALGLLNNKHIPDIYQFASPAQRLALVQGLMDTDGNARDNGGCRFVNTDLRLIEGLRQLLWSLGVPNSLTKAPNKVEWWKDGYVRSDCYVVSFSGLDCFRLPRKRERLKAHKGRYSRYIRFEPTETVPTQCIAVDAPDELYLIDKGCIVTHNTKFCSKMFPAWYLGRNPHHKYLQGGHSQDFAEKEFGVAVRDIIKNPNYTKVFPRATLTSRSTAAGNWMLDNRRGKYVCKGVGQKIAGYRGNCGGGDDLIGSKKDADSSTMRNDAWNWLWADFRTRFLPGSPIFIIATRWHPDDVIGRIEQYNREGKGLPWEIINFNGIVETEEEAALDPLGRDVGEALWPEYYTSDILFDLKATLEGRDWNALYKGRPTDAEGNAVKGAWFGRYDALPQDVKAPNGTILEKRRRRITVSVDTANKATKRAKYTAIGVWIEDMDRRHYLAEVVRKKVEFNDLVAEIEAAATRWGADAILVEDKGSGTQYIQTRQGKAPAPVIPIAPGTNDKEFRFDGVMPMIEAGEVYIPRTARWLPDFESEVLAFPNGTYSDQVDMTSQYLSWAREKRKYGSRKLGGTSHVGARRRA